MNFEVCKKEDKKVKYTVINLEKDCYKNIKKNIKLYKINNSSYSFYR